jgi:hypothetical protein
MAWLVDLLVFGVPLALIGVGVTKYYGGQPTKKDHKDNQEKDEE